MKDSLSPIGELVKGYRLRAAISQERLAEIAGVSVRTIAGLEAGEGRYPRRETLAMLADGLKLTLIERASLLDLKPNPKPFPTELPRFATSLIGRDEALQDALALIQHGHHTLITILGPAGVGKTHFAATLAGLLATEHPYRLYWVSLDVLSSSDDVPLSIFQALKLRDQGKKPRLESIRSALQMHPSIVILDNFEHVLDAKLLLADLWRSCPNTILLVTSRAPLALHAETIFPLAPLALPDLQAVPSLEELEKISSVQLFLQKVQQREPHVRLTVANVAPITALTVALDGLPLALELAAARCRYLSPEEVLQRLRLGLSVLESIQPDIPERHHSLSAALAWSYHSLPHDTKRIFALLSMFKGGVSSQMLLDVCQRLALPSHLVEQSVQTLLDHCLIRRDIQTHRITMLATIRQFANEQTLLVQTVTEDFLGFAVCLLDYFQAKAKKYATLDEEEYLQFCDVEYGNARTVLHWAITTHHETIGQALAVALQRWWELRGFLSEGRNWFDRLLSVDIRVTAGAGEALLIQAYSAGAIVAYLQGDYSQAMTWLDCAEQNGLTEPDAAHLADIAGIRGLIEEKLGNFHQAEKLFTYAYTTFDQGGDFTKRGRMQQRLGNIHYLRGHYDQASGWYRRALADLKISHDMRALAGTLGNLANIAFQYNDLTQAEHWYRETLAIAHQLGDVMYLGKTLAQLGQLARRRTHFEEAIAYANEAHALYKQAGFLFGEAEILRDKGYVFVSQRAYVQALAAFQDSLKVFVRLQSRYGALTVIIPAAHALLAWGKPHEAILMAQFARSEQSDLGISLDAEDAELLQEVLQQPDLHMPLQPSLPPPLESIIEAFLLMPEFYQT